MSLKRKAVSKRTVSVPASTVSNYVALREAIGEVHRACQGRAAAAVNQALTMRNWLVGSYIVQYDQHGRDRADYGAQLLDRLAADLKEHGIPGLSSRSLRVCRQVYAAYPIW